MMIKMCRWRVFVTQN